MMDRTVQVMEWNKDFICNNVKSCCEEMLLFVDTVFDCLEKLDLAGKTEKEIENALSTPKVWYVSHLLLPSLGAISINLLIGNPRGCFMELRLLLEGLACCYTSKTIEEMKSCQGKTDLMKQVDNMLNLKGNSSFKALWKNLSAWIHVSGFNKWVSEWLEGRENMYSWIFMVPVKYGEVDIPVLEKLAEKISIFRTLLERIIE